MKKWICVLLTMCMLFSLMLMPAQAGACETGMESALAQLNEIESGNASWEKADLRTRTGLSIVASANGRIEKIILDSCRMAEKTNNEMEIVAIIASMCVSTRLISKTAQKAAALCGVYTVCEYVEVKIGNHTVMVDPLRVVLV